jgi:hypothetical protein
MQRAKLPAQPETWSVPLNLDLDFFAQMHTNPAAQDDLTEKRWTRPAPFPNLHTARPAWAGYVLGLLPILFTEALG